MYRTETERPLFVLSSTGATTNVAKYAESTVLPHLVSLGYRGAYFRISSSPVYEGNLKAYKEEVAQGMAQFSEVIRRAAGFLLVNCEPGFSGGLLGSEVVTAHAGLWTAQMGLASGLEVPRYAMHLSFRSRTTETMLLAQLGALGAVDLQGDLGGIPSAPPAAASSGQPALPA